MDIFDPQGDRAERSGPFSGGQDQIAGGFPEALVQVQIGVLVDLTESGTLGSPDDLRHREVVEFMAERLKRRRGLVHVQAYHMDFLGATAPPG